MKFQEKAIGKKVFYKPQRSLEHTLWDLEEKIKPRNKKVCTDRMM